MFPGRHDDMVSTRQPRGGSTDSLVLLTLLPRLQDWCHDEQNDEVLWSPTFGDHVGVLVALELVWLLSTTAGERTTGIIFVGFWKNFLAKLEHFLERFLPALCHFVHQLCDLPLPPNGLEAYSYQALRDERRISVAAVNNNSFEISFKEMISNQNF